MDASIAIAAIAALPPVLAVAVTAFFGHRKLEVIRVDVNSNMADALERIGDLEQELRVARKAPAE